MALQRQRLAESQLLDRQARRVLHDDVLPRLHAAMLTLNGAKSTPAESIALLGDVHRQISDLLRQMPAATAPEVGRLGLVGALRRTLDDELGGAFDSVVWQLESGAEAQLQTLPALTAEVLFYAAREAIRNAARYGRDTDTARPLHLRIGASIKDGMKIFIEDDGVGMDPARPSAHGGGQGLALHSTLLAVVGGALAVESTPGAFPKGRCGTRVVLALPREAGNSELDQGRISE